MKNLMRSLIVFGSVVLAAGGSLSLSSVRRVAIRHVGIVGSPAIPLLMKSLEDNDPQVRAEALDGLVAIGPRALPALIEALSRRNNSHSEVHLDALVILSQMGSDAAPAVPALVDALDDADGDVRWLAAKALKHIDPHAASKVGTQ